MRSSVQAVLAVMLLTAAAWAGLNVVSPTNGSTVGSPVHFVASASSGYPITAVRIYVDNVSLYTVASANLDTYLQLSVGSHSVVVQAWDSSGAVFRQTETITVVANANGVTVSSPANGASVSSPVNIVASAAASAGITAMMIYIDNQSAYSTFGAKLNTSLAMSAGQHYVVVQAWDSRGTVYKSPLTLNVAAASTDIPANAAVFRNIEQMSGWESCTTCAGAGGNGPTAAYSVTQGVTSPSMDGSSTQFHLGGGTPYSDALWWKQLGANNAASHFVYDLYFYLTSPQYAQALEFDVNQSVNGYKYIFGVECAPRGSGQWDVWDGTAKVWRPTGIACPAPSAYTWHHLTEEFQRGNNGQATFVAITLDGVKHDVNRTYQSVPSSVSEINVAFQMDGDYAQHAFSTWVDQVTLSYW